jgi:hypothetical protein
MRAAIPSSHATVGVRRSFRFQLPTSVMDRGVSVCHNEPNRRSPRLKGETKTQPEGLGWVRLRLGEKRHSVRLQVLDFNGPGEHVLHTQLVKEVQSVFGVDDLVVTVMKKQAGLRCAYIALFIQENAMYRHAQAIAEGRCPHSEMDSMTPELLERICQGDEIIKVVNDGIREYSKQNLTARPEEALSDAATVAVDLTMTQLVQAAVLIRHKYFDGPAPDKETFDAVAYDVDPDSGRSVLQSWQVHDHLIELAHVYTNVKAVGGSVYGMIVNTNDKRAKPNRSGHYFNAVMTIAPNPTGTVVHPGTFYPDGVVATAMDVEPEPTKMHTPVMYTPVDGEPDTPVDGVPDILIGAPVGAVSGAVIEKVKEDISVDRVGLKIPVEFGSLQNRNPLKLTGKLTVQQKRRWATLPTEDTAKTALRNLEIPGCAHVVLNETIVDGARRTVLRNDGVVNLCNSTEGEHTRNEARCQVQNPDNAFLKPTDADGMVQDKGIRVNDDDTSPHYTYKHSITLTRLDLHKLDDEEWLNDHLINVLLDMVKGQSCIPNLKSNLKSPVYTVVPMSTFFLTDALQGNSTESRRRDAVRWARKGLFPKYSIFDFDLIVLPMNKDKVHWGVVIVHIRGKTIEHYDSCGRQLLRQHFARVLWWIQYCASELHCNIDVETEGWRFIDMCDAAMIQDNGNDCGLYTVLHVFLRMLGVPPRSSKGVSTLSPDEVTCFRRNVQARLLMPRSFSRIHWGRNFSDTL